MRMLRVGNGNAESSFALLKKQRIAFTAYRCGFKAEHDAAGENARTELSLSHGHKPVRGEESVPTSRSRLLHIENENIGMKHQHPAAFRGHEHCCGSRYRLCVCTRGCM